MSLIELQNEAIALLKKLIETPSYSREEGETASILAEYIESKGYCAERLLNNVWTRSKQWHEGRPIILLNSHHDTVKPVAGWTYPPHSATCLEDGKIVGLGSNDAGAALVSLLVSFLWLDANTKQSYNLLFAATAEEEVSGKQGAEILIPQLGNIALGVVGEPTQMHLAIAEKGLMVLDCLAEGKAGHAARNEGINAIYKALDDVQWFRTFDFPKKSEQLGLVKITVSVIKAGTQHNVVPDRCEFTVDVRTNGCYTNEEALGIIKQNVSSAVEARSLRLNSSQLPLEHPIVQRGIALNRTYYGSPTMSDQVFMPFNTLKIGPGDSARSHTANEYIYEQEIREGIELYCKLLDGLVL